MAPEKCPGCDRIFVLRQGSGFCPKCSSLEKVARNSSQYTEIEACLQCTACGIFRKHNMPKTAVPDYQSCGSNSCNQHFSELLGIRSSSGHKTANIPATHQELAQKTASRFKISAPALTNNSGHLTTAVLQHQETVLRNNDYSYVIHWQANCIGGTVRVAKGFGVHMHPCEGKDFMSEIMATLLAIFNAKLTHNEVRPKVSANEASLCFYGNRAPIPGTEYLTLEQFYVRHSNTIEKLEFYIESLPKSIPKAKNAKSRRLFLELTVEWGQYLKRIEETGSLSNSASLFSQVMAPKSSRKGDMLAASSSSLRKYTLSRAAGSNSSYAFDKRPRTMASIGSVRSTMQSAYQPPSNFQSITVYTPSQVVLKRIDCEVDQVRYMPNFRILHDTELKGSLDDKPFATGGMKLAYNLLINKEQFVAKRYYKFSSGTAGEGTNQFGIQEMVEQNKAMIYLDAGNLMQCRLFLKLFYSRAEKSGVKEIDHNIMFAKCFLVQEMGSTPSTASALDTNYINGLDNIEGLTWLVEEKRSSAVEKFTGTLSHGRSASTSKGLVAETVHTFAHFVFDLTAGQLAVADLQANPEAVIMERVRSMALSKITLAASFVKLWVLEEEDELEDELPNRDDRPHERYDPVRG